MCTQHPSSGDPGAARIDGKFAGPKARITRDWSVAPGTTLNNVKRHRALPPNKPVIKEAGAATPYFCSSLWIKQCSSLNMLTAHSSILFCLPPSPRKHWIVIRVGSVVSGVCVSPECLRSFTLILTIEYIYLRLIVGYIDSACTVREWRPDLGCYCSNSVLPKNPF